MGDRKHKNNLEGLLRFAVNHTKSEDTTRPVEMDEERKHFLQNALKSMTSDIIDELESAMTTLYKEDSDISKKLSALNAIRDRIDNIDFANNFVQIGGTQIIIKYLKSDQCKLRVSAMYIVAEMAQNNPFCQKHFVDNDVLPLLLPYFKESEDISSSAMHAVSSLIRNFGDGLSVFLKIGGIEALMMCLCSEYPRLFVKACFLVACLCVEHSFLRDEFVKNSAVSVLQAKMDPVLEYDSKLETILFALAELTTSDIWSPTVESGRNMEMCLREVMLNCGEKEQCEDMVSYIEKILKNISNRS